MGRRGGGRWGEAEDEAFLEALAHFKHIRQAAAAIGWSVPTAQHRRRTHAPFAERWAELTARPPLQWRPLVTQPHRVGNRAGPARPKRVRAVKPWTEEIENEFLDLLASTCNVLFSAQSVGYPDTSPIYRRRRQDPAFHRAWGDAIAQGYARLEAEYIRVCAEAVEGREFKEHPLGPITAADVHRLLAMHRNEVKGQGRRPGSRPAPPPIEQVIDRIIQRAAAIRAARTQSPSPLAGVSGRPGSQPGLDNAGRCPPGTGLGRGGGGDSHQENPSDGSDYRDTPEE